MQGVILPRTQSDVPMGPAINFSSFRKYNAPTATPNVHNPNTQHLQNVQNTLPQGYNPYVDPAVSTSENWTKKHLGQSVLSVNSTKDNKQSAKVEAAGAMATYNANHHQGVPVKPGKERRLILWAIALGLLIALTAGLAYLFYFYKSHQNSKNLQQQKVQVPTQNRQCQQGFFLHGNRCITCPLGAKWNGQHCVKSRSTKHLHVEQIS